MHTFEAYTNSPIRYRVLAPTGYGAVTQGALYSNIETKEEAAAWVSYLNGGAHPILQAEQLKQCEAMKEYREANGLEVTQ